MSPISVTAEEFQALLDLTQERFKARIAELEAERDALKQKVAHLDKLVELGIISIGGACEDRDALKHSDRALRKEIAALRKALEDAPHDVDCSATCICPNTAAHICNCWKARIPLPTLQTLAASSPDGERAANT